jgi:hypothetical protein
VSQEFINTNTKACACNGCVPIVSDYAGASTETNWPQRYGTGQRTAFIRCETTQATTKWTWCTVPPENGSCIKRYTEHYCQLGHGGVWYDREATSRLHLQVRRVSHMENMGTDVRRLPRHVHCDHIKGGAEKRENLKLTMRFRPAVKFLLHVGS